MQTLIKGKSLSCIVVLSLTLAISGISQAAQPSGAASFNLYKYPITTAVGGDPVNISIQVLNGDGDVNLTSNGQAGDVLFNVSSSLGTVLTPANTSPADKGKLGNFATVSSTNLAPVAGNKLLNIVYGGLAGKDTITITMCAAISDTAGSTICGDQIGAPQTVTVTVAEGVGITEILDVICTNDVDIACDQLNQVDDGLCDGDNTYVDQDETIVDRVTSFRVKTPAGQSGTVKLEFVGIDRRDLFGNNAYGTTVSNENCIVSNGTGSCTATFEKAGYYEVRASAGGDTVKFTKAEGVGAWAATDIIGDRYALRVRPKQATRLGLSFQKQVLTDSAAPNVNGNALNQVTVSRTDDKGNLSGYLDPTLSWPAGAAPADTYSISAVGPSGSASFAAGLAFADGAATNVTTPILTATVNPGNTSTVLTAVAKGTGYTDSAVVNIIVAADLTAAETGGGAVAGEIISAQIDNGSGAALPAGAVTFAVGQTLRVLNISAGSDANDTRRLGTRQPVSLNLGRGVVLAGGLVAAGLSAADSDGDGTTDDLFNASFALPTKALVAASAVLEFGNGNFGSYRLGNAAEADYTSINVVAGAVVTVKLINPNGFDITGFDARFRGRSFNIPNTAQNAHIGQLDGNGNDVLNAGLTVRLTSPNLIGGNNCELAIGKDSFDDCLLTWSPTFKGSDEITATPMQLSGIPPFIITIANIGVNDVASIKVTAATECPMPSSIMPVVIETTDLTGKRGSGGVANNLIISLVTTETVARMVEADGKTTIITGSIIDTLTPGGYTPVGGFGAGIDGRLVIGLDAGNRKGDLTIKVETVDGEISGETNGAGGCYPYCGSALTATPSNVNFDTAGESKDVVIGGGLPPYAIKTPPDEAVATTDFKADGVTLTITSVDPSGATRVVVCDSCPDPGPQCITIEIVSGDCFINISPTSVELKPGETQQFTASNESCGAIGVYTWSVSGACGGTIDNKGLYTAPSTVTVTCTDTVKARDAANYDVEATATVTIMPPPHNIEVEQEFLVRNRFLPLPALLTVSTIGGGDCVEFLTMVEIESEPLSVLKLAALRNRHTNTIQQFILVLPSILNGINEDETIWVGIPVCSTGTDTVIIQVRP